jgi:undecaprenyl diphosphate synthase
LSANKVWDGNGRWAKKRKLPRIVGHKKGVDTVREIVKHCGVIGVQTLTLFAKTLNQFISLIV